MSPSTHPIRRVTVYGGAVAKSEAMRSTAYQFGQLLAAEGLSLVFGGGNMGLMGAVAEGAHSGGAEIISVIPKLFRSEHAFAQASEVIKTEDFGTRKQRMFELGDAFVALPGGLGTLGELIDIWDWSRLGLHQKPFGLLDVDGYYDKFLGAFDHMAETGFFEPVDRGMLQFSTDGAELLSKLRAYQPETSEPPWARF